MFTRIATLVIALLVAATTMVYAQTPSATVRGTLLDQQSNLPIAGATITLRRDGSAVGQTRTDGSGQFSFSNQAPGTYTVTVEATGYGSAESQAVIVGTNAAVATLSLALSRQTTNAAGLREIGRVTASANSTAALQTTATITRRIEPTVAQDENFSRLGSSLEQIAGVNLRNRDTTVGDDQTIDIRGLKPSETQALLDGHPIGPMGVEPGTTATYNFQDSPPFALQNTQVTFGAGALNLYGTSTTGGTVDMQTWDPTPTNQYTFQEGIGDEGKTFTNVRATGMLGSKLGFAFVHAVEGTYGPFAPQTIESNGALGTNFTSKNIAFNTYTVSGNYLLHNDLLKLRYDLSPVTQFTVTGFAANSYDDKTGNGDNAFTTYADQLYIAPVKTTGACPGKVAVTLNSGTACWTAQQWAAATTGPQFARPAFQTIGNQDYHARLTTIAGNNNITVDSFVDAYNVIYNRNLSSVDPTDGDFNGGFNQNIYHTTGFLVSDDIVSATNTTGFGYYAQNQTVTGTTYQDPLLFATPGQPPLVARQPAALVNDNFFLRNTYMITPRFTTYANVWVKSSSVTHGSSIDPRLSLVYRLTNRDVVRVAGAKSEGDPDPTLAEGNLNTTPANINPPCGAYKAYEQAGGTGAYTGSTTNVGQVGNPSLSPERATDLEFAYSHRFAADSQINVDLYDTNETNQIFNAAVPVLAGQIPQGLLNEFYQQITNLCGISNPQLAFLSLTQASNQSAARFKGVEVSGRVRILPSLYADYGYDLQSAEQLGVPTALLKTNPYIINGAQILLIPLHKYTVGLDWTTRTGFETRLDIEHLDAYNGLNRPGYFDGNGFIKYHATKNVTFALGCYNIFNTDAQTYDYVGAGSYWAENSVVTQAANAFQENNVKLRGLTPRAIDFSITFQH